MMRVLKMLIFLCSISILGMAQEGGLHTYEFLNLSPNAHVTGLGGRQIAVYNDNPSMGFTNPSLINAKMHRQLNVGAVLYPGDVYYGDAFYARSISDKLNMAGGVHFVHYGSFEGLDANGNPSSNFNALETALSVGASYKYKGLVYGLNTNWVMSSFESYSSFGAALDASVAYVDSVGNFIVTVVAKNIGTQFSTYRPDNQEPLPFDMRMAVSKRLQYLPFRFTVTAHDLHKWDIRYDDPNVETGSTILGGEETEVEKNYFADKLFRHLIFSGQFYFGKRINVNFGYDHQRRQELKVLSTFGLSGFSFGAGLDFKRFDVQFGSMLFNPAGNSGHFSFGMKI